jgi:hypothetical protein
LPALAQSRVLVGWDAAGVLAADDKGASRRQLEDAVELFVELRAGVCVEDWPRGSIGVAPGWVLIGLRVGRDMPDWRLTGRLAVSELAAPGLTASRLAGSAVKLSGKRYFIDGGGLAEAEAIEAPELPCSIRFR